MTYEEQCNKYFAPIDEISEALANGEGINCMGSKELFSIVESNSELREDLAIYG